MKQVKIGKPFTVVVPSDGGGRLYIKTDATGSHKANVDLVRIQKGSGKNPIIEMHGQDGLLIVEDFAPSSVLVLVVRENGDRLTGIQDNTENDSTFREIIELAYNDLFPDFKTINNAIVFDQSFYTRALGQIELAKSIESVQAGKLLGVYDLFSGVGFGAIMAAWAACGGEMSFLSDWWATKLKKAMKSNLSILRTSRRSQGPVRKAVRKLFKQNGRDLTFGDLQKDLFIPYMDISGRTIAFRKEDHQGTPIYIAVLGSLLDPDLFNTKPIVDKFRGEKYGISAGSFVKSPRNFIQKNNPSIVCTEIGSPARIYNHKQDKKPAIAVAGIYKEIAFRSEERSGHNTIFHLANPIDGIRKIDLRKKATNLAIQSGQNGN